MALEANANRQIRLSVEDRSTVLVFMLGTLTRPKDPTGGVPLAGSGSAMTKAFELCCAARNFIALCSAVSISASSAFLISAD